MCIDRCLKELQRVSDDVKKRLSDLPDRDLNWKKSSDFWSIAQVLQHIEQFNKSYFPIFRQIRSGQFRGPLIAKIPGLAGLYGMLLKKSASPDRRFKMKTFSVWEPSDGDKIEKSLELFESHQMTLISEINATIQVAGGETIITSPASDWIVYRLDTAICLISSHERRHYQQILEVLEDMNRGNND